MEPKKFGRPAKQLSEEGNKSMSELVRSPAREESSKERAARRAAELRGHLGEEITDVTDEFAIPESEIPDGWTYEWKRHTVYGAEDPSYEIALKRAGWSPVPVSRHPHMMQKGYTGETILRKGMILYECPTEIVQDRKAAEYRKARDQVRYKEAQLAGTPEGTMTRDHARVKPSIKKGYEPIPIPE